MQKRMAEAQPFSGPVYLWAGLDAPDAPPDRVPVESCRDCAALVPVAQFDVHGAWHAQSAQAIR